MLAKCPALVSLGFVLAMLAGCLGTHHVPPAAAGVRGTECFGAFQGACRIVEGMLHVHGVVVEGGPDAETGILLQKLQLPLLMQDVQVRGFKVALRVDETCPSCHMTLRRVALESSEIGVLLGEDGTVSGPVSFYQVRVTQVKTGLEATTGKNETFDGISALQVPGILALRDVHLVSSAEFGIALRASGAEALEASEVRISGFSRAVVGGWKSVAFHNTTIQCRHEAMLLFPFPEARIDGLHVTGCSETRRRCGDLCGVDAISFLGGLEGHGKMLQINRLFLANFSQGIYARGYEHVQLRNFTITNGQVGAQISAKNLTVQDGRFSEQDWVGLNVAVGESLDIRRVDFAYNGVEETNSLARVGGLVIQAGHMIVEGRPLTPLSVHQSSFTNNRPFGLTAWGDADVVNATHNWWGSPAGPSPMTPAALGNPVVPGFGDMVVGQVMHYPHLLEAPRR